MTEWQIYLPWLEKIVASGPPEQAALEILIVVTILQGEGVDWDWIYSATRSIVNKL